MTKTRKTKTRKTETTVQESHVLETTPGDEIDRLGTMKISELQALFAEVTGKPTRCPNRTYLVRSILEAAVPADMGTSTEPGSQAIETEPGGMIAAGPDSEPEAQAIETATPNATMAATPATQGVSEAEPNGALEEAPDDSAKTGAAEPAAGPAIESAGEIADDTNLSKLDVPALQVRYREVSGRATTSTSRNYLLYRLREAQKGRIPVGPRPRHQKAGDAVMVLPLRMEADLVDKLDEAWRRLGLRNRMDLFRRSLRSYLASIGEADVAALLATEA